MVEHRRDQTVLSPVQLTSGIPRPPRLLFRLLVFVSSLKLQSYSVLKILQQSCSCKHCKQTHWLPDVDECVEEAAPCGPVGECRNNVGSYSCVCPDGYRRINDTLCRGNSDPRITHSFIPVLQRNIHSIFRAKWQYLRLKSKCLLE